MAYVQETIGNYRSNCHVHLTNEVGYITLMPQLPWFIVDNHTLALGLRPRVSWWLSTINHGNRGITIT